ncbi:hypothetical protein HHL16_23295 [Pseudoflavitalea sp. G-6-1-2]|uniref:hypothetical protein n=1 Tax=Pseudoflavitalea sp. G-6-1-2 TaxID=2728841 RepID=UPI00146E2EA5|nr:hypothetical protein [Pseudoflavitalea sp. G-6-1-2]NML23826.1 hypothetical protein [Pseudoflavitalea sp. G-6-1-2]
MRVIYTFIALLLTQFSVGQVNEPITVTNQYLNITGALVVGSWKSEHPNKAYPDYPKMYYGFAEGDELILDFSTENKKGTQAIEITEFESRSVVYSNSGFQTLNGIRIKVPKTAVYKFEFATNHIFDRQAKVIIKRIPASDVTKNFNCNVTWKTVVDTTFTFVEEQRKVSSSYETVTLQAPIDQFVNSGSNADFKGGKSRILCKVTLPPNTVEWYYSFAASRNKNDIAKIRSGMKLFSEIAGIIDRTGFLSLGLNALTQPPGADYCHVYLLKPQYIQAFLAKDDSNWMYMAEGTKENLKSGLVRVKNCCTQNVYYLGFKNPDYTVGVSIMYEIVAVVEKPEYEIVQVKKPVSVNTKKIPFYGN